MQQLNEDQHNRGASVTLYDRYAPMIFTYVYRHVQDQRDAEDILAEVFLAAFKNERMGELPEEQQLAWLQRVAHNKVIDRYRRGVRIALQPLELALEVVDPELSPEEQVIRREAYERLYRSLEQLPALQRQVVRLRFGHGLRLVEIAELLNKPEGTIRNTLMRTLRHLRAIYGQR